MSTLSKEQALELVQEILNDATYAKQFSGPMYTQEMEAAKLRSANRILNAQDSSKDFVQCFGMLAKIAHDNARSKGFWDMIDSLKEHPRYIEIEAMWKLSRMALFHAEVSEALEGVRKKLQDDHLPHRTMEVTELADVIIRIFDYVGAYNLPLAEVVLEKMKYNSGRPFMHGDKLA